MVSVEELTLHRCGSLLHNTLALLGASYRCNRQKGCKRENQRPL